MSCFDLLVPHMGELVGGSVREERADVLEEKMREEGMILPEQSSSQSHSFVFIAGTVLTEKQTRDRTHGTSPCVSSGLRRTEALVWASSGW